MILGLIIFLIVLAALVVGGYFIYKYFVQNIDSLIPTPPPLPTPPIPIPFSSENESAQSRDFNSKEILLLPVIESVQVDKEEIIFDDFDLNSQPKEV